MNESKLSHLIDPLREMLGQYGMIIGGFRERSGAKIAGVTCDMFPPEAAAAAESALAVRGKRLNVIAAFLSTGRVISAALWCAINALIFVGFLGRCASRSGATATNGRAGPRRSFRASTRAARSGTPRASGSARYA